MAPVWLTQIFRLLGYFDVALVSVIGLRLWSYFDSFFFHWPHYRQLNAVRADDLTRLPRIPNIKVQITTRGGQGSYPVIVRGINAIMRLAHENPAFYRAFLSVEVVTESADQQINLKAQYLDAPLRVSAIVIPADYVPPNGTLLKARGLHYMVERRRHGFNAMPGRTVIVHYDEESVMPPDELRKLIHYIATSDKRLTEGPIYYPLEYRDTNVICRAMEANRPVGCFECREVMDAGTPLHMHGSNLVIDEDLENELGWDIGTLDGEPFIAEDYVFGMLAYLRYGPTIFGWHGAAMLEQPPFSVKSAMRQRFRWVIGIFQGIAMMRRMPEFRRLPWRMRTHLTLGTQFRVVTFALGLPAGVISLAYTIYQAALILTGHVFLPLPLPLMIWLMVVGFLWLNSLYIGSWFNVTAAFEMTPWQRSIETMKVIAVAPIAGIVESAAAFSAVTQWTLGRRQVVWQPTPKTSYADRKVRDGKTGSATLSTPVPSRAPLHTR